MKSPIQYPGYAGNNAVYKFTVPGTSFAQSLPELSSGKSFNFLYSFLFRLFDILFSLVLILILLLFLPFIWIANHVYDRGPLFYTQRRVGKYGRIFTMYKLRSMVVEAEANGACFTSVNDNRITRVGSFLRKTRLDELPQAINVFKGDMAIIGPRPERPEFVDILTGRSSSYYLRHLVKPGITGWAQVKYKYTDNLDDGLIKLSYDLHYIANRNLKIDTTILALTVLIVAGKKGT